MTANAPDTLVLRLERTIAAAQQQVYDAWTIPDVLTKWSSPEGMTIPDGDMDLRVGGTWHVVMVAPDGARHEAFGTYLEIDPPHRLVYTHQWRQESGNSPETRLTVEFVPLTEDSTNVILTQTGFESAGARDGHRQGWSSSLDKLEQLFVRS